jgi:nucleoside-diphosphate-sugar epimerase
MRKTVMRVLVDGDRGYIGAVLVPFLRAAGHDVVGLDVGWYDGCDFGPQPGGCEQRTGDIRDAAPGTSRALMPSFISRLSLTTRSVT